MTRISVDELCRGDGAGAKYRSGGIMGAVKKEILLHSIPASYDEQTWGELLIVKRMLAVAGKLRKEGDSISAMTDTGSLSSYVKET